MSASGSKPTIKPEWLERPGELLLTIYIRRRRWLRWRSNWSIEWRYGGDILVDGEFSITLAEGWCDPHMVLTEVRLAGFYRELLG